MSASDDPGRFEAERAAGLRRQTQLQAARVRLERGETISEAAIVFMAPTARAQAP